MERNTLLAIVLSVSLLFVYNAAVVAPHRAKALNETKLKQAQLVTDKTNNFISTALKKQEASTDVIQKPITTEIKTTKFELNGINVGGSLHNVKFNTGKHALPVFDILGIERFGSTIFKLEATANDQVVYVYKTSSLEIKKTYDLKDNVIKVRMEIINKDQGAVPDVKIKAFEIDSSRLETFDQRETMLDEYSALVAGKIVRKGSAAKFDPKESKTLDGQGDWVAFREHYNAIVIKPLFDTKAIEFKQVSEKKLAVYIISKQPQTSYDFIVYIGPQNKELMGSIDATFSKVLAFSGFFPLEIISQGIYQGILWVQAIVKNWGASIILMSMFIYGVTYPLTIKSMMSMRKMQAVGPKMAALKEKYKNDPQKLNQETIEIYKREKINPFGGCLPMLLQMPFFMAIYQVLWRAYYFEGKSFLWIKDLSQPDRLFMLPFSLPFLGNDFNILPLLMGGVMFWQQKISAKTMVITDDTQAMQQKMMTIIFPIFITFIFYKFASSLSLYFTMFYLFSALTQLKMSKVK